MRPAFLILLAVLLGLAVAPYPSSPAAASCAGPTLKNVQDLVLARGASSTVEGRSFADGCQDSMSCSAVPGCGSCEYDDPPPTPLQDVELRLRQRGVTWSLGTADAGTAEDKRLGWVTWTFDLPPGVEPGRARLIADHAEPVTVRIAGGRRAAR